MGNGHGGAGNQSYNGNFDVLSVEEAQKFQGIDSHSSGGKYGLQKNKSIEDFTALQGQPNLPEGFFFEQKPKNTQVNPPAIIQKNKGSNKEYGGSHHFVMGGINPELPQQSSKNNATKETLLKMTQERGIAHNSIQ